MHACIYRGNSVRSSTRTFIPIHTRSHLFLFLSLAHTYLQYMTIIGLAGGTPEENAAKMATASLLEESGGHILEVRG